MNPWQKPSFQPILRFLLLSILMLSGCSAAPGPTVASLPSPTTLAPTLPIRITQETTPIASPTSIPTSTPAATLTATAAITPTPAGPVSVEQIQDGIPALGLALQTEDEIWLYDASGNLLQIFHFNEGSPWFATRTQDCHWAVTVLGDVSGSEVWKLDSQGKRVGYYLEANKTQDIWNVFPTLSPSGQWVSLARWSGELYRAGGEFQDVFVLPANQPEAEQQVTEKGGAWLYGGTWAPDEDVLAFTDYDAQGALQVYTWQPGDAKKKQLTHYDNVGWKANRVEWSPDGAWAAVVVYQEQADGSPFPSELWAVSTQGAGNQKIRLDKLQSYDIEWLDQPQGTLFARSLYEGREHIAVWVSLPGEKLEHEVTDADTSAPEGLFTGIFFQDAFAIPGSQAVGFISAGDGIYQYNPQDHSYTQWISPEALRDLPIESLFLEIFTVSEGRMAGCKPL